MTSDTNIRSLLLRTEKEIAYLLSGRAQEIATAGFLQDANRLLQALWQYDFNPDWYGWMSRIGLTLLWDAAGSRPENIPFELENPDELEVQIRNYFVPTGGDYVDRDAPSIQGFHKARLVAMGGNMVSFPSQETELEAVALLEALPIDPYFDIGGKAFLLGAELAARQGEDDRAVALLRKYSESKHVWGGLVACCRHLAPLLLKGAMTDMLQYSAERARTEVDDSIAILIERMERGITLTHGDLDWRTLLEGISKKALGEKPDKYDKAIQASGWLGFEGAAGEAISAAEQRLGLQLPEDYKAFLHVSNGFRRFPLMNPALLPVEKIDFLKNREDEDMFEILSSYVSPVDEDAEVTFADYIDRAIVIGESDETETWLIPPGEHTDNWQTWVFGAWKPGADAYPGFRHYIENEL